MHYLLDVSTRYVVGCYSCIRVIGVVVTEKRLLRCETELLRAVHRASLLALFLVSGCAPHWRVLWCCLQETDVCVSA